MLDLHEILNLDIKIIQKHDEGEQRRKHKKKRINKKWLKRYGVYGKQMLEPGKLVIFEDGIYISRPHFQKLKSQLYQQTK